MRLAFIAAGIWLCAAVPAPAATLLVLNKQDATLSFIDAESGRLVGTVATGESPHEVEVSRDGTVAVISNYGGQEAGTSLSVIDITGRTERRIPLQGLLRPHGLAATAEGVYFTAEDSRQIGRLNLSTHQVDWRVDTGQDRTHMVVASADGRTLYASNMQSGSISVITPAVGGSAGQKVVPVGNGPEGLALSPDGRELWAANSAGGNVAIIDVATRAVVDTFDIGTRRANRVKFTPDGKLVLVSDLEAGELVVIDVPTRKVKERLMVGRGASGILVVPDGSRAYVAISSERRLAVVDLGSLTVEATVATGNSPDGMAWAP